MTESDSKEVRVLVVASQTLGGAKLLEAVRAHASKAQAEGRTPRFFLVVPETQPRHGNFIYEEAVRDAAQVRVDLARASLRNEGFEMVGEVGDADPFLAAMDAIAEFHPDRVIVSTLPATTSGWLRRDLPERIAEASGLPVEHIVVDLDREGLPFTVTLVIANQTVTGLALIERLKEKAAEAEQHIFIVVVPQPDGGGHATAEARARLRETLRRLHEAGLVSAGMIGNPDPYIATLNALQSFRVSEVIISTLAETRSGWLREHLIERVQKATSASVEHVVVRDTEPAQAST